MTAEAQTDTKCTCGSCIDGWLSPRMKERLEGEADFLHYVSSSLLEDVAHNMPADDALPEWCVAADAALQYVPTQLAPQMTPRFYRGYMLVMENIMQLFLAEPDDGDGPAPAPNLAALSVRLAEQQARAAALRSAPAATEKPLAFCSDADADALAHFLAAGGTPAFALEALLDRAEEKSPRGAEYRRKAAVRAEEAEFAREVAALPACAHDLDFDLVRRRMGLPDERPGVQWCFLSDSEAEEEGEDRDGDGEEAVYEGQQATTGSY